MRTRVIAACIALSCSAPPPVAKPEPALAVKTYAPLAIKADAKAPHQAVILGTDAHGGSTVVPLPVAPGAGVVDTMVARSGAPFVVKLATAPNSDGAPHVSVEDPGGAGGPAWRAGVWMAALVAVTTLDKDLTDFTFSATSGGASDGIAASGLLAAGLLVAMTGAAIDPAATLTGAVLPDGTLGPVDALPERFAASLASGKKRIGYPAGMRNARSAKTGKPVDLVELAKRHGAQAIAIADVHAAYALLTGNTLPAPQPVDAADMALAAATTSWLDASYKRWQQQLAREWAGILQLESAGRLPVLLVQLRDDAKRSAETAERLRKQNRHAAAHARIVAAVVHARSANRIYDVLAAVQANKLDAALAAFDELASLDDAMKATFGKLGALAPTTLGGHLQMLAASRTALRGWVFDDAATRARGGARTYLESLRGTDAATLGSETIGEAVVAQIAPTVLHGARAGAELAVADEQLELGSDRDVAYTMAADSALRIASAYRGVAAASTEYIDALVVDRVARRAKRTNDEARAQLATHAPDYLVAMTAARLPTLDGLPKELATSWGESSLAWAMLSLAAAELAYAHAAELIANHAALEVELDGAYRIKSVEHERALAAMLAAAERAARSHARAARIATGAIPVQAKLAYQAAMAEKDGPVAAKLDALARFWTASAFAQAAVTLARN